MNSRVNETVRPCGLSQNGRGEARSGLRRGRALLQGAVLPRVNLLLMTLVAVMAGLLSLQAADVLIAPVAATAQSYFSNGGDVRSPTKAIDGSGMTPNAPVTASSTTSNTSGLPEWLSNGIRYTWITFDLGSVQSLTGFHLWNANQDGANEIQRGVRTAGIYAGTNLLAAGSDYASAGAAWGTLVENMTFAQGTRSTTYAGSDYTFAAPVTTRYLQLYVTDNFAGADTYTGIAEIRFYASPQYTVTGESSESAYTVSGTDLLQTHLGSTVDALGLNNFGASYPNSGTVALTDGVYGTAGIDNTCQISGGSVTYLLNTVEHPAGYVITNINTYCGWQDFGRDGQRYTVSFRKAGSSTFGDDITVSYDGEPNPKDQTHINIEGLSLAGVDAVRFAFPEQENLGVGYKEFDVLGSVPTYAEVTRLDSGAKVIASDAASDVRITEGTGTLGDITLGAPETAIRSLTQGTTAGIATINPAGQALSVNGIYLQPDAGGLTIASGTLTKATGTELFVENRSANGVTVNAVIADGMGAVTPLTKTGGGTLTLNNVNTYSGVTIFGGGVIDIATLSNYGSSGSLGKRVADGFGNVGLLFRGGTLRYAGATAQRTDRAIRINADGGGGNAGGATLDASGSDPAATLYFTAAASPDFFEWGGTRSLTLTGSNAGNNTFGMAIGEAGVTRVVKSGSGTWVLTGANAYSGETRIEGGTLKGACPLFAPIAATAESWYTPDNRSPTAAINGAGMTPNNPVAAYSTAGNVPANAMWLSNGTRDTWITFDLGSVRTVTGFRLWNYNEWSTGTVEPYRGVRTAGIYTGTNLLADGSSYTTSAGAAWGTLVTNMTFTRASATAADPGNDYTFAAPVTTRYLQLYVTGNFPGADPYTGISEIRFYDLPGAFLPGNTAVNLTTSGAALILGLANQTVGSLAGAAGSSVVNDGTLTAGGDNSSQTFAGVISGSGAYIKQGSGTQTFSGANTYGGATTVSAGTLEITQSDALPAGTAVEIATGAGMLLSNAGEQQVAALTFDSVPQYKGTWGGPASSAQHRKAMFTGTGVLRVLTGPASPGMMILIF